MANAVLLFNTAGTAKSAARLHDSCCPVVTAARNSRGRVRVIAEDIAAQVADLEERGWQVKQCKCCK